MKKRGWILLSCLFLALTVGCAAPHGPTHVGDGAPMQLRIDGKTTISVDGTLNKLFASADDGKLLVGLSDADNKVIAASGVTETGRPVLSILDRDKNATVQIELDQAGEPALFMRSKNNTSLVAAGMDKNGLPFLGLVAGEVKSGPKVRMGYKMFDGKAVPFTLINSEDNKVSVRSGITSTGGPFSEMTDSKGRVRLRFGIGENDAPYFELLDESGKPTWSAR